MDLYFEAAGGAAPLDPVAQCKPGHAVYYTWPGRGGRTRSRLAARRTASGRYVLVHDDWHTWSVRLWTASPADPRWFLGGGRKTDALALLADEAELDRRAAKVLAGAAA